jgi:hypothetical protein
MRQAILITMLLLIFSLTASAQTDQQTLKREVTLYNPYKPSLSDFLKKSYLPDISDTSRVRPDFKYNIETAAYTPQYTISQIKAASLVPDPLIKLYKSYINLGFGNYLTPLAELSITNERSKKGEIGLYARHYSTNGKLELQNDKKVYAGYMDNDVTLFGKRFFTDNSLGGSVNFMQKVRYAYGYDTSLVDYNPSKSDIRFAYQDAGANISFASMTLDSSSLSYHFDLSYDLFFRSGNRYQNNIGFKGAMATTYKGFYAGSDIEYQYYRPSAAIYDGSKYIASISPFIMKSTQQWSFRAGLQMLLDKNIASAAKFHLYPDLKFNIAIVPSYLSFYTGLNGKLEINDPIHIIDENPYLIADTLFKLPNTSYPLIISAGLKGNAANGTAYILSASYSFVDNMLFYSSIDMPKSIIPPQMGNIFMPLTDNGEIFRLHGEIGGPFTDKMSYSVRGNWYSYTLSTYSYPWNMPEWDAGAGVRYNLRDKILAGADLTITGDRKLAASSVENGIPDIIFNAPAHVNLNLRAEYRYSKILAFWLKVNNITYNRYFEWAWYPSQRLQIMAGLSYSL